MRLEDRNHSVVVGRHLLLVSFVLGGAIGTARAGSKETAPRAKLDLIASRPSPPSAGALSPLCSNLRLHSDDGDNRHAPDAHANRLLDAKSRRRKLVFDINGAAVHNVRKVPVHPYINVFKN